MNIKNRLKKKNKKRQTEVCVLAIPPWNGQAMAEYRRNIKWGIMRYRLQVFPSRKYLQIHGK